MPEKLTYEEWYDLNEDDINIELAESGADHEGDFNPELEFEERYQKYCDEEPLVLDVDALTEVDEWVDSNKRESI